MFKLLAIRPWDEVLSNIATIIGSLAIIFIIIEHIANKNVRNIQLMQRCIDLFRDWYSKPDKKVDISYLELLNEELFYFQKGLIQKKVAVEWIEGMPDFIVIFSITGKPLNKYKNQIDISSLDRDGDNRSFFYRVYYFKDTQLTDDYVIPSCNEDLILHHFKKREVALQLYKHIRKYKY